MTYTIGRADILVGGLIRVTRPAESGGGSLTGRPYISIVETASDVYAYRYNGGIYSHEIATNSISSIGTGRDVAIMSLSPLIICWTGSTHIRIWNVDTNTVSTVAASSPSIPSVPLVSDFNGTCYYVHNTVNNLSYVCYAIDASGTRTRLTPASPGDDVEFLDGVYSPITAFYNGAGASVAVYADLPEDRGYVKTGGFQSEFIADDFLPFVTSSEEWTNWAYPRRIPGSASSCVLYGVASFDGLKIGIIDGTPFGTLDATVIGSSSSAVLHCAGLDGNSAVVYDYSTNKILRVAIPTPQALLTWEDFESSPNGYPTLLACLD